MKFTRIASAAILLTVLAHGAIAASLDTGEISADASWVAHLDATLLKQTELGGYLVDQMATPKVNRQFDAFKAIFQFDPREDLESVTLYGTGQGKEEGVAILRGRFNTDQLVTLIKGNEHYDSTVHGTRILHSWIDEKDEGERTYGCVTRNDQVVVGDSETLVKHAVDVLEGRAHNMTGAESLPGLADAVQSTFFIGSVDMRNMPDVDPKAAVLKKNEAVSLCFSETNGRLNGLMRMVSKDERTATAVYAVAQGLISLVMLDEDQPPEVVELAQGLQFTVNGKEVAVRLDYPAEAAIKLLKQSEGKKKAKLTAKQTAKKKARKKAKQTETTD